MKVLKHVVGGLLVIGALAVAAPPAEAAFIRNAFGLVNPDVTIHFDELALPTGTVVDDEYAAFGVTFSPDMVQYVAAGAPFAGISGGYLGNFGAPPPPPIQNPFSIYFNAPVSEAAFAIAANQTTPPSDFTTFTPYLNGVQVAGPANAFIFSNLPEFAYIGIVDLIFDEIRIDVQLNGAMVLDNLQYKGVPEPATLSLFGAAALGMLARARRRRTTQR